MGKKREETRERSTARTGWREETRWKRRRWREKSAVEKLVARLHGKVPSTETPRHGDASGDLLSRVGEVITTGEATVTWEHFITGHRNLVRRPDSSGAPSHDDGQQFAGGIIVQRTSLMLVCTFASILRARYRSLMSPNRSRDTKLYFQTVGDV